MTATAPVLVALHAHPDDEAIFTGGTIVRAVEAGWRVVLVVATDGDQGAGPDCGRTPLGARRRDETMAAAAVLGVARVVFLGHGDSGYGVPDGGRSGTATARSLQSGTLAAAHVDGVAAVVRRLMGDEGATALTSYDDNGIYGHVDHVQVHEIAARSVEGTECELYEATLDRRVLRVLRTGMVARGLLPDLWPPSLTARLGVEHGPAMVAVDVTPQLDRKLLAVAAHSSQVVEASSFMGLPAGVFHHLLRTEWFRVARRGRGRFLGMLEATDGLAPAPPESATVPAPGQGAARPVLTG
jgi:LmbE family N-acetylglucosaminyl deacetylase